MDFVDMGVLDMVYKYGALPLLIFAVKVLWSKVTNHELKIEKLNEAQKDDLRNHAEEVKSLQQNTISALQNIDNSRQND